MFSKLSPDSSQLENIRNGCIVGPGFKLASNVHSTIACYKYVGLCVKVAILKNAG